MKSDAHGWIGTIPLGRGSQATSLCKRVTIAEVVAVPLDTADIAVGSSLMFPEWICPYCRKVKVEKSNERQFVYAIRDSRESRAQGRSE